MSAPKCRGKAGARTQRQTETERERKRERERERKKRESQGRKRHSARFRGICANMFWRVQGEEQASPLEKILDKDSFTLEELLLEEDIIQEVSED